MGAIQIKWSSFLNLTDVEFDPAPPKRLTLADEVTQTIAWLTAVTPHDRRLLRCDNNGALLVAQPWSNLSVVQNDELYPGPGDPDTYTATKDNKGLLVATSTEIVYAIFSRVMGGEMESIYIPPNTLYWYPHSTYSVTLNTVPLATGTASYVGISAFG